MKYEVIDNFLDEEYFNSLVTFFTGIGAEVEQLPWFFRRRLNLDHNTAEDNLFYMIHTVYENNMPLSSAFEKLIPLLQKLEVVCLMRIRGNLFPNTGTI